MWSPDEADLGPGFRITGNCGFNLTCQLMWMLSGKLFLFDRFPLRSATTYCMCSLSRDQLLTWKKFFFVLLLMSWNLFFIFFDSFKTNEILTIFIWFCCKDYTLTHHLLPSEGMNRSWTRQHRWRSKRKWKASETTCHLLFKIFPFSYCCSPKYPQYPSPYSTEAADSLMNTGLVILYGRAKHISNISTVRHQAVVLCPV